jgi:hypothetical protein
MPHRQRGYALDLIAIADAPVVFAPCALLCVAQQVVARDVVTVRMRNLRLLASASDTKSSDQR